MTSDLCQGVCASVLFFFLFFSFAATTENFLLTHITVCNVFIYSCKISPQDVPLFHSLQPTGTCLFSAAESGDCKTTKHSRARRRKRSKVCLHERSSVCTDMSTILFFCTLDLLGFSWTSTKRHKKNDSTVCLLAHSLKLLLLIQIFILNRKSSNVFISLKHLKHEHISHFNKLNCLANNSLHHSWRTVCEVSVLMLVLLSGYEPAYAVGPQDGVQSEACDEEDGEDQQPVDAPHGNAREGTEAVYVCHISIRAGFKTWNTQSWITHGCKFHLSGCSDLFYMTQNDLPTTQFWPFWAQTSKLYIM